MVSTPKQQRERYNRRKANNLCVGCGKTAPITDRVKCVRCSVKTIAYERTGAGTAHNIDSLLEKFTGVCALSGLPIAIGVNAELDHIKPVSKYPELAHDVDNVQWVDVHVNFAKRDMDQDEFIAMCRRVAEVAEK